MNKYSVMGGNELADLVSELHIPGGYSGDAKSYYSVINGALTDYSDNAHYTIITVRGLRKMLTGKPEDIIGYKVPIDLFGGDIKEGEVYETHPSNKDLYIPLEEPSNSKGRAYYSIPGEVVKTWEPVLRDNFKVGDWAIARKEQFETESIWNTAFQITKLEPASGGDQYVHTEKGHNQRLSRMRLATEEEIQAAQSLTVAGYTSEFLPGRRVKFGCQTIDEADLIVLKKLMGASELGLKLTSHGVNITTAELDKLLKNIKD